MKNNKKNIIVFFIALLTVLSIWNKIDSVLYRIERNILSKVSVKNVIDYENYKNKNMLLYYTKEDTEYINMIKIMVDTYYPLLCNDFQVYGNIPTFILYPDKESFCSSVKIDKENVPMGVFYGGIIHILSPRCWTNADNETMCKDIFLRQGPIVHELSHYLLDIKTNGNYEVWFTEGLALYYEYKYIGFEWQKNLKTKAQSITVKQLQRNFNSLDEGLAYRKSFDIIYNIVENNGERYLQDSCKTLH